MVASISDELTTKFFDAAPDKVLKTVNAAENAVKKTKDTAVSTGKTLISGVVLVFKGGKFTADAVMSKVGNMMANRNGTVEKGRNSISMEDLYSEGKVTRLDDTISKDVMKYFNRHCDKTGIKYSVMKESGTDKYYVFFKSSQLEAIKTIMQGAYKDYMAERRQQAKGGPWQEKDAGDKKKDSVRERLKEEHAKVHSGEELDRNHSRSERSR